MAKRSDQVATQLAEANAQLEKLDARWQEEKGLVDRLLELRSQLRDGSKPVDGTGRCYRFDSSIRRRDGRCSPK